MVLLTSSAVSVAISSSVVCVFTFLLFLSGYVLQQQTVRSLQEALRRPPESRTVLPTVPSQFQNSENDTGNGDGSLGQVIDRPITGLTSEDGLDSAHPYLESIQVPVVTQKLSGLQLDDRVGTTSDGQVDRDTGRGRSAPRLAYLFALSEPSDLCSILLFAKQQRQTSRLPREPAIVLLYPSTWEADPSPSQVSVLGFMRDVQDLYDLTYHPVKINPGWDVQDQLLGEVQWNRWNYDQAMYLRSPGLSVDHQKLDRALSDVGARKPWTPLRASAGDEPAVLLVTPTGLQTPRREMRRLATSAGSGDLEAHRHDSNEQPSADDSAYLVLDREQLRRKAFEDVWHQDVAHRYLQGVESVCAGSQLLADGR